MEYQNIGGIILAAGKGTRMRSDMINKVVLPIKGKPMILYSVELLESCKIAPIIVVVGFAKESVREILGSRVIFAEQIQQQGSADAVSCGLSEMPDDKAYAIVMNGDDSAFYNQQTLQTLIDTHITSGNVLTLLTLEVENPFGLGRILRDEEKNLIKIIEEKDATEEQRKISEINTGLYVFSTSFLLKYLPLVKKSSVTGEYYIVSLVALALDHDEKMGTVTENNMQWRGVNTKEELAEAERLLATMH